MAVYESPRFTRIERMDELDAEKGEGIITKSRLRLRQRHRRYHASRTALHLEVVGADS